MFTSYLFIFLSMNKYSKKLIAWISVFTILLANLSSLTVNAAGLNGNTLTAAAVVWNITITSTGVPFVVGATVSATVNGTVRVGTVTSTSVITITDPDGTVNGIVDPLNYNISVTEDNGTPTNTLDDVFFSVAYNNITAWTAGSDRIVVTASVLPTLSMTIGSSSLSLWVLTPGSAVSTVNSVVVVSTNAVNGYSFSIQNGQAAGLIDWVKTIATATYGGVLVNSNKFGVQLITPGVSSTLATAAGQIGNATVWLTATSQLAITSAGPVNASSNTIQYAAAVDALQAAGNYSTSLTYSLTGSF